ncbi:hypothetical protein MJO28_003599 [Puccinia striiformis f. sp. tritici]|uniref:Uncharacterized protein n=1 Tax=Puccinia striiformis f. sp. tritici TaxID=168172 RepID=A0ACC0ENX0_9BASI|nr:hypothetical protein MJO28_003599 [Puccinia striiformis f. sp. tritici]
MHALQCDVPSSGWINSDPDQTTSEVSVLTNRIQCWGINSMCVDKSISRSSEMTLGDTFSERISLHAILHKMSPIA